jgi:hypothetical protein
MHEIMRQYALPRHVDFRIGSVTAHVLKTVALVVILPLLGDQQHPKLSNDVVWPAIVVLWAA